MNKNKSVYDVNDFTQVLTKDKDDANVVSNIRNKWNRFLSETREIRRQWLINSAFSRGQQWSVLHKTEDRLVTPQQPPGRPTVTIDKISPWKEHIIAAMVTGVPSFECVPKNQDSECISATRVGNGLLEYYWDTWVFMKQYIEICKYLIDFGNAFIFLDYIEDNSKYEMKEVTNPDTGEVLYDNEGLPLIERYAVGDIKSFVLLPHMVGFPTDTRELKDKEWIVIVQNKPLEYFPQQYGSIGNDVVAEKVDVNDPYNIRRISKTYYYEQAKNVEYANEITYLQKPCEANPDGMMVIIAGNVLLKKEKYPYKKLNDYPIIHFHTNKESGEYLARSWIERQIPVQRMYNLIWSIMIENADNMAHLKWLVPREAGVDKINDMTDVVRFNHPFVPTQSDVKPLPNYIQVMINGLETNLRDLQNFHSVSMGGSESGVRSSNHAQNLQDQDLMPLTVVDNIISTCFQDMGEKILLIAAEKLTDDRMIQYVGKDKRFMTMKFRGAMLEGISKVNVRLTNTWARNKSAVSNTILQMYQYGMVADNYGKPDPKKAMRLLEFALPDNVFSDMQKNSDIAFRENDRVLNMQPVKAFPWQDHNLHLSIHNEFMNSAEFMVLIEEAGNKPENVDIITAMQTHVGEHTQLFQQALSGLAPSPQQQQQNSKTQSTQTAAKQ